MICLNKTVSIYQILLLRWHMSSENSKPSVLKNFSLRSNFTSEATSLVPKERISLKKSGSPKGTVTQLWDGFGSPAGDQVAALTAHRAVIHYRSRPNPPSSLPWKYPCIRDAGVFSWWTRMDSDHRSLRNRFTVCPLWPLGNSSILLARFIWASLYIIAWQDWFVNTFFAFL